MEGKGKEKWMLLLVGWLTPTPKNDNDKRKSKNVARAEKHKLLGNVNVGHKIRQQ